MGAESRMSKCGKEERRRGGGRRQGQCRNMSWRLRMLLSVGRYSNSLNLKRSLSLLLMPPPPPTISASLVSIPLPSRILSLVPNPFDSHPDSRPRLLSRKSHAFSLPPHPSTPHLSSPMHARTHTHLARALAARPKGDSEKEAAADLHHRAHFASGGAVSLEHLHQISAGVCV